MFEDERGCAAVVETLVVEDKSAILRARDIHILALANRGFDTEAIALYFNLSVRTVQRRLKAIPTEARAYYGRALVRMDDPFRAARA